MFFLSFVLSMLIRLNLLPVLVAAATENPEAKTIKYPIDDLLVEPAEEDRLLTERPCPYRDFNVPMDCVGNLLMVWDFCSSYGRLFNLSPFSLEDFENSLCYKDSTPLLIVESYSTLFRLLLNDTGKFSMAVENKKRKSKVIHLRKYIYVTVISHLRSYICGRLINHHYFLVLVVSFLSTLTS